MSEREIKGKAALQLHEKGGAGTIRIILQRVSSNGRSSALLSDGTVLVACSRQPFLDAARALILAGHAPNTWLVGWREGGLGWSLRSQLGHAAKLAVDEHKVCFAHWKAFPSSAVGAPVRFSEEAATTYLRAS